MCARPPPPPDRLATHPANPILQPPNQTKPQVGDLVEVAWKGKVRLESLDIYQGLAWWSAVVVDKRQDGSRYKIHYPG